MKNLPLSIGIIMKSLIAIFLLSCDTPSESSMNADRADNVVDLLDRNIFTESFIKEKIKLGMSRKDVESLLGHANNSDEFMGGRRSVYFLSAPQSKGLHLVGFSVLYSESGFVDSVDLQWMGVP
jgi:hypothetical protein